MAGEYFIPQPPEEVFSRKREDPNLAILRENRTQFIIEKITYDGPMRVWYVGIPQPRKGFPTPASVSAVNIVKHVFIEAVKTARMWPFAAAWFVSLITSHGRKPSKHGKNGVIDYGDPKASGIEKLLASFNRICYGVVSPHILKPEHMTELASELQGLMFAFMRRLGISRANAHPFCLVFGSLIEYDNAYRYRLEDIFTETSKKALQENPRREISRLIKLYCSREKDWGVAMKFRTISMLTTSLFWVPRVRKAFTKALEGCDFERLQLDDIDRYWCKVRNDYDFFGETYEYRMRDHVPVQGYQITV